MFDCKAVDSPKDPSKKLTTPSQIQRDREDLWENLFIYLLLLVW